jgi:hypothetical protein
MGDLDNRLSPFLRAPGGSPNESENRLEESIQS